MSYTIYKTDAIILRMIPRGETSWDLVLLTRDLGKIVARAQAARVMHSKMRMHISRYRQVVIDVVRGKHIWRLTGIHEREPYDGTVPSMVRGTIPKLVRLLEHLVVGEMAYPELFVTITSLIDQEPLIATSRNYAAFELFGAIKILEKLGYWSGREVPDVIDEETLETCSAEKKQLVAMINDSLGATQIMV